MSSFKDSPVAGRSPTMPTITDNSDYTAGQNSLPSTGIPYVIINGTIVVKDSTVQKDVFPGQPIRNKALD